MLIGQIVYGQQYSDGIIDVIGGSAITENKLKGAKTR